MKYTCTHGFCVPKYDEDGRLTDYSDVEHGDVYELVDMSRSFAGGPNSVRLKGAKNSPKPDTQYGPPVMILNERKMTNEHTD